MLKMIEKYVKAHKESKEKKEKINDEIYSIEKSIKKKEEKIVKLKEEINEICQAEPRWVEAIIIPLRDAISEKTGLYTKEPYGPFGLRSSISIYFSEKENFDIVEDDVIGITILPRDLTEGKLNYETGETEDLYQKGTLGYINGMNHVEKPLPQDLDEIIKLLR